MTIPAVSPLEKYITPDGRLTPKGLEMFSRMLDALRTNEAALADHETRITALEP